VESEEKSIAKELLGKQVPAATDAQATIEELFGTMSFIRPVQSGYKEELVEFRSSK
jgi:hypothetical protein